jgi:hypothetical protein
MSGNVSGVGANNSSERESVAGTEAVQYRDADDNGGSSGHLDTDAMSSVDPNISGTLPTKDTHPWLAGKMSGWQDNDDYMEYTYDTAKVGESRLLSQGCVRTGYSLMDGDYDDNGGYDKPPMVNFREEEDYEFGNDKHEPQGEFSGGESEISGIRVFPVVRR